MHIVVYGGCVPRKSLGAGAVGGRARVVARERRVILLLFVASVASVAFGRCERCDDVTCLLVVTRTKFVIVTFFYTLSPARPNEAPRVPTQALVSRFGRSKFRSSPVRNLKETSVGHGGYWSRPPCARSSRDLTLSLARPDSLTRAGLDRRALAHRAT